MDGLHLHHWWTCSTDKLTKSLLKDFSQSEYKPQRLDKRSYKAALDMLLANLIQADRFNVPLIYKRDTSTKKGDIKSDVINRIVDWMVVTSLASGKVGIRSQTAKIASTVWLTDNTRYLIEHHKVKVQLATGKPFLELYETIKKDGAKLRRPLPFPPRSKGKVADLNKPIEAYNRMWLDNEACLTNGKVIIPFGKRCFSKDLDHGGRFYWHDQTIGKELRGDILINGEPTVELDYKAIHFNLLYNDVGLQFEGDPYTMDKFDRGVIKLAMISFMNTENREGWKANITKSGNPVNKRRVAKGEKLKGFIAGMPDNIIGRRLADAIDYKHLPIKHLFHGKDIGIRLQAKDAQIMSLIITECAKRDIPLLPYHDGVRVPESAKEAVYSIMKESYRKVTGFDIVVDC